MKQYIFPIMLLVGFAGALTAQPLNNSTPEADRKAAEQAKAEYNYYAALEKFEKIYDETKDKEAQAEIGRLNYLLRDYERAERTFQRLVNRDRLGQFTELKYWYAMSMKANGKYAEAIDVFNQYVGEGKDSALIVASKREIAGAELARKAKQPEGLTVNNIGKKANNPHTEASPSYSGGELYFASLRAKDIIEPGKGDEEDTPMAKIYTASPQAGGAEFGEPTELGTNINREGFEQGNVSITPDGKTMYFTRVARENQEVTESKIHYAMKGSSGWGAANEVTGVNGDFIAKHPCEGELFGERVLFFVANMPGGKGGFDIYYAPKRQDGQFGAPVNLGDVINTPGDDVSPFYRDGHLYFSSNGRPTIGGMDVFDSQWNGSKWSEPKMLPLGVNTSLDDMYYTQSADGYTGFLVSNRPGPNNLKSKTCCDDIYAWEIERVKVNLMARTFRLRRKNEKENQPLTNTTVAIYDVTDKNNDPTRVDERTQPQSHEFSFTLQPERSYVVIANADKYQPDTVSFNTVGVKKTTTVEKRLTLRLKRPEIVYDTIRTNQPIRLSNIYYDFDDDKILPESEPDLQALLELMNRYGEMKIELSSHTDARGKDEYNAELSQRRANSAKRWLVQRGVKDDRIVAKGYGETLLLNECKNGVECDEEKHRFNRRTEFKIIAGPTEITMERIEKRERPADSGNKKN